tara:strand:- start:1156 stop:1521 length:366 start_codon:yes stop_codon:yes gene_type:complete
METKIVQWVHCDNKIKEYNEKSKSVKELREKLSQEIFNELDIENKDKSDLPVFNIHPLKASIIPQITNSYESYTNKFYLECFTEYLGSESKAKELIKFMKDKRKIEKKYSIKRENLMNLDD